MSDGADYVIWSNEHRAWWGPGRCGYVRSLDAAGRYGREAALWIARNARSGWEPGENPPEIALPLADAQEQARGRFPY